MIGIIQFFLKLGQNEGIIEGVKNKKLTSQIVMTGLVYNRRRPNGPALLGA
jgi:hypothetical protein